MDLPRVSLRQVETVTCPQKETVDCRLKTGKALTHLETVAWAAPEMLHSLGWGIRSMVVEMNYQKQGFLRSSVEDPTDCYSVLMDFFHLLVCSYRGTFAMEACQGKATQNLSREASSVHLFALNSIARHSVVGPRSLRMQGLGRTGLALGQRRPRSPDPSQEISRRVLWPVVVIQETF